MEVIIGPLSAFVIDFGEEVRRRAGHSACLEAPNGCNRDS